MTVTVLRSRMVDKTNHIVIVKHNANNPETYYQRYTVAENGQMFLDYSMPWHSEQAAIDHWSDGIAAHRDMLAYNPGGSLE